MKTNSIVLKNLSYSSHTNHLDLSNIDEVIRDLHKQIRSIESYCGPSKRTQTIRNEIIFLKQNFPDTKELDSRVNLLE